MQQQFSDVAKLDLKLKNLLGIKAPSIVQIGQKLSMHLASSKCAVLLCRITHALINILKEI